MPRTHVVFYREDDERVPVLDWLKELRASDHRAYETCVAAIERLGSRTKEAACGLPERRHSRATGRSRLIHPGTPTLRREGIAMAKTKDALKILDRVTGNSDSIKAGIAAARANLEVAQMICDARTNAGLSQSELAALIGSKQPVIARLEDARL